MYVKSSSVSDGLSGPRQARAWPALVSVCQRLVNARQHLDAPGPHLGYAWPTSVSTWMRLSVPGLRLASAWTTYALPSMPRDPDNYPPPESEAVRGFKSCQCTGARRRL